MQVDFIVNRYSKQSNLVYLNTIVAQVLFAFVFLWMGVPILFFSSLGTMPISLGAIYFNRKNRVGLAAFIFIAGMSLHNAFVIVMLGILPGFLYYFFNFANLIVFTNWSKKLKFLGVALQVFLIVGLFHYGYTQAPFIVLSDAYVLGLHYSSTLLNVTGIAHSAYFFVQLVDKTQAELITQTKTDYLTGIMNRMAFMESVNIELNRSLRNTTGLGVLMCDIDLFKQINDTYGHLVGDVVLQKTSQLLSQHMRSYDLIARFGGEEFIMLMQANDLQQVINAAERMRQEVENHPYVVENHTLKITLSFGAVYKAPSSEFKSIEHLINEVDQMLYLSKQNGRNQTHSKMIK